MARTPHRTPSSNIYTILIFAAALALLIAIGFTWYRSTQVFPKDSPLSPKAQGVSVKLPTPVTRL